MMYRDFSRTVFLHSLYVTVSLLMGEMSSVESEVMPVCVCEMITLWSLLCAGVDPSLQIDHRIHTSAQVAPPGSKQNKPRVANSRDERFRSGTGIPLLNQHHRHSDSDACKREVHFIMLL